MFLIEVIPFARLPRLLPDTFSYFSKDPIPEGAVVEIEVRQRKLLGMVLSSAQVKDSKQQLRTASFMLKKIGRIVSETPILNSRDWELLKWLSLHYLTAPATILRMLVPSFAFQGRDIGSWERRGDILKNPESHLSILIGAPVEKIYLQAVAAALADEKQILVITPEISKAEELVEKLALTIPREKLLPVNSRERGTLLRRRWHGVRRGEPVVVIGSRLPLFFPFVALGLIIVDDESAPAHKSWDQEPRYVAPEIAVKLHELHGGELYLAGNPPSLATYQTAKTNTEVKTVYISRYAPQPLSLFVEMEKEIKEAGEFIVFSQVLKDKLRVTMMDRGRAFLFVNRKGFAPFILCRDCGYVFRCSNCAVPLVYHLQESLKEPTLLCHHCSAKNQAPDTCAGCGSHRLKLYGIGIERVAGEVKKILPGVPVITIAADQTQKPADLKKLVARLESMESYVAIGTEFALTSVRLPPAELTAIISVDTALALPDYSQNERLFRILSLVRDITTKHFIFQSYAKEPEILRDLFHGSFEHFAEKELKERRKFSYPPFSELIKLTISRENRELALKEVKDLHRGLTFMKARLSDSTVEVSPPYPAYIEKKKGQYIFHILIKILELKKSLAVKELLNQFIPGNVKIDVSPLSLL
ncbi:MAG: primosomal protein N' [Candidatus Sungbacteria bacterium]|uniref:Probable replication restart protein PriA n=1 Tax=Candidatus Sungiibacteriota bacterium TaxID=2750080 RepID=A0A931SD54_9BACT|nr:primosomal protein N' [Candidatus Sungbacteria bacterium]